MPSGNNIYQKGDFLHRVDIGKEYDAENTNAELKPQPICISSDGNLISGSHAHLPISLKKILVESKMIDEELSEKVMHAEIIIHAQAFNGEQAHIRCKNDINELKIFLDAVKSVSVDHNIDNIHLEPIKVDQLEVLYRNDALMFSALRERKLRFALVWKAWKPRIVQIYSNGSISYSNPNQTHIPRHKFFVLKKVHATLMTDESIAGETDIVNTGVIIKCQTLDGIESYFRCIMNNKEIDAFFTAIRKVAEEHNLDQLKEGQLEVKPKRHSVLNLFRSKASIMRRAATSAMDKYDKRTKRERIMSKRGAFKWLPILGANDLIHGSWWFVIGSIGMVITCSVVIRNKETPLMNDDDSTLPYSVFQASWVLMLLSSVCSLLGSLAFVRAFNEDPPMAPLFPNYYHLQSDELLGSWFFFLCCVPTVPYVFIYVIQYNYGYLYLIMFAFAIIACLGALLFVRSCYPVDNPKKHYDLLLPATKYLCGCYCTEKWRKHHFMNDWLGGCWLFYWVCLFALPPMLIYFFYAASKHNALQMFVFGTSFLEDIAFTIGCACFVAGSYPEGYNEELIDTSQTVGDPVFNPTLGLTETNHSEMSESTDDLQKVRIGFSDFSGHAGYSKVHEEV